ncbi:hypothetical protein J4Q44_G00345590 [Coregonus suidteri]|uniref:Reverse transcriptase domain-containing protein n=1 Tax=Coregonus suidteri TaxID=861788 RepID=A0AAN8KQ19_9TELE
MLFIDYSSAFNTIVPSKLIIKLEALGLNPALCNWVLEFLTGRPQVVKATTTKNEQELSLTSDEAWAGPLITELLARLDRISSHNFGYR